MKRIVSVFSALCILLGCFSCVNFSVFAEQAEHKKYSTLDPDKTAEYMMNGKLNSESNLLLGLMPRRVYSYNGTSVKEYSKTAVNTGTNGVNSYTNSGSNALYQYNKCIMELTNGIVDVTVNNEIPIDTNIWRIKAKHYLGFEYDLGESVTLNNFYVAFTSGEQGNERTVKVYEIYASDDISSLYSAPIYSVTDNTDGINIVKMNAKKARYFAVRILEPDNGTPTESICPRIKEFALDGIRDDNDYAKFSGIESSFSFGTTSVKEFMDGADVSSKTNLIFKKSPVEAKYYSGSSSQNVSMSDASYMTNGEFADNQYIRGYFSKETYLNDNTYADFVYDLGQSYNINEFWAVYRRELDDNPFFVEKYAIYASNDKTTLFSGNPICTVDGNTHNMNKITFSDRNARYFGLRVIVPIMQYPDGTSLNVMGTANIRIQIVEIALIGKVPVDYKITAKTADMREIDVDLGTYSAFPGETKRISIPSEISSGSNKYLFKSFLVNGNAVDTALNGTDYEADVKFDKSTVLSAVYSDAVGVTQIKTLITGSGEKDLSESKKTYTVAQDVDFTVKSDVTMSYDGMNYALDGWNINGSFVSAVANGEYTFKATSDTVIKEMYTPSGGGQYMAIFESLSGERLASFGIPADKSISETVEKASIDAIPVPKIYGRKFVAWSGDLATVYNTTVTFTPIYEDVSSAQDVIVDGNSIGSYKFNQKITLTGSDSDFSAYKNGNSVISTTENSTLFCPGKISITKEIFGKNKRTLDRVYLINGVSEKISKIKSDFIVLSGIGEVNKEDFVSAGVVFTDADGYMSFADDIEGKFIIGSPKTVENHIKRYPSDKVFAVELSAVKNYEKRYARSFVKYNKNGTTVTAYSNTVICFDKGEISMPRSIFADAFEKYKNHPVLPLYGDNDIPYYNSTYATMTVNSSTESGNNPSIQPYLVKGSTSAVLIFPGGGYFQRSDRSEGIAVAEELNKQGVSAFVVRYRVGNSSDVFNGYDHKAIITDGQRAVQFVRYNADMFDIAPDKIVTMGFSAGGHLAMVTAQNEHEENVIGDDIGNTSSLADANVLGYAVTTLLTGTFSTMPRILVGSDTAHQSDICNKYTMNVTDKTPPTFVWHGTADTAVKPEYNSTAYKNALAEKGIPYEYHAYEGVAHGVGLAAGTSASGWLTTAVNFLKNNGF